MLLERNTLIVLFTCSSWKSTYKSEDKNVGRAYLSIAYMFEKQIFYSNYLLSQKITS